MGGQDSPDPAGHTLDVQLRDPIRLPNHIEFGSFGFWRSQDYERVQTDLHMLTDY